MLSLLHEVVEIELRLADQQRSHDVNNRKGIQFVGLVDVVIAIREGIRA